MKAMLMVKNPEAEHWEGCGQKEFQVLPRVGEHIEVTLEKEGIAYLYEVAAVHHPERPATSAVDIYGVRCGEKGQAVKNLYHETEAW